MRAVSLALGLAAAMAWAAPVQAENIKIGVLKVSACGPVFRAGEGLFRQGRPDRRAHFRTSRSSSRKA